MKSSNPPPGILEREQEQSVVYGSIDFGKTVVTSDKYKDLVSHVYLKFWSLDRSENVVFWNILFFKMLFFGWTDLTLYWGLQSILTSIIFSSVAEDCQSTENKKTHVSFILSNCPNRICLVVGILGSWLS